MANKYDGCEIEIINWDKYNPRKNLKASAWFRLQNSLFEDPNLFDFSDSEFLFWIYLMSIASKKQTGQIRLSVPHVEKVGRTKDKSIESAIEKLIDLKCINVTTHARHTHDTLPNTTDITDRHNITDITNTPESEKNSDNPGEASPFSNHTRLVEVLKERGVKISTQRSWVDAFPDDAWIAQEIFKAISWEEANPKRRKKDFARFVTNWMTNGWDRRKVGAPGATWTRTEQNRAALDEYLNKLEGQS